MPGCEDLYASATDHQRYIMRSAGIAPATEGGGLFCGVMAQEFAIDGVTYQWPRGSKLAWNLGFSRLGSLGDMDLKQSVKEALQEVEDCCDLAFEYTANPRLANVLAKVARLDGKNGVLAQMGIPVGNVSETTTQLNGEFDDSESWVISDNPQPGQIDFYRVWLHEFEHALGLGHKPANVPGDALIAPIYSPRIRHLCDLDKQELVRRYGPSKSAPTAPKSDAGIVGRIEVEIDGVKYAAQGTLKKVA